MAGWGAFVGREHELSRLQEALAGQARLVLVVGDAGIGKTRFVSEGLARAAHDGMLTISGGCLPLAQNLPLLPVADALGELTRLGGGLPFEAALEVAPTYVRSEVARLLPKLAGGDPTATEPSGTEPLEAWRYERLFAGVTELVAGVARLSSLGLLIEDVHWADGATLDFLTYLPRAGRASPVTVVVTCRSDEVPLDAAVADWLNHARRNAGVAEIRLGPLSQYEVAELVTGLVQAQPPAGLVEEVYARAEGHPFFTEQLVAAAVTDSGQLTQPVALPERLAELLVARAARCGGDARTVLNALAVAGRPLTELMLGEVTGLDPDPVRSAVGELGGARLLAAPIGVAHRARHALLAEAVAAELLPGERVSLHERVARALENAGDETLVAEAAGHWAAAGRAAEELRARLAAANAAEQVFAYADAATHWQRAIELYEAEPDADLGDGWAAPHLYLRAVDALEASGDTTGARAVADDAYSRFAEHPDRATAAVVHFRAGWLRAIDSPAAGEPLMKEGLRLFEGTPPSLEQARAWLRYALDYLFVVKGRQPVEIRAALGSGLRVAEAAGAASVTAPLHCLLAAESFIAGDVEEGFRLLAQARSELEPSPDAWATLWVAILESDALLKVGKLEEATRVGLRGFDDARKLGFGSFGGASTSLGNAIEGLLGRGRTADAAALIDPLITEPVDADNWPLHCARAEIDLLRGEIDAAGQRLAQIHVDDIPEFAGELGRDVAEVALWAGRPEDALEAVQGALERRGEYDWVMKSGSLLTVGMRSCAELAERARALRDDDAVRAALTAADNLVSWVSREQGVPFTDHPFMATIPAIRATWNAERSRVAGASDSAIWGVAAYQWEALDYRHRGAYCWWRCAEAQLGAGQPPREAAVPVRAAAAAADGHAPLLAEIRALARRARISLDTPSTAVPPAPVPQVSMSYGLTERELDVLRLLTHGCSNAEIGAELFISPRTAGVHVTNILRKLDVTNRVQAAALAERAGLFDGGESDGSVMHRGIG
jgi:DNA-binding CsgD family transcriptional regulator